MERFFWVLSPLQAIDSPLKLFKYPWLLWVCVVGLSTQALSCRQIVMYINIYCMSTLGDAGLNPEGASVTLWQSWSTVVRRWAPPPLDLIRVYSRQKHNILLKYFLFVKICCFFKFSCGLYLGMLTIFKISSDTGIITKYKINLALNIKGDL